MGTRNCTHLFVEFVPPPLSIGSDHTVTPSEIEVEGMRIKILSPTDCIKDRLASYLYFEARGNLEKESQS
jgi:hypothetical protein